MQNRYKSSKLCEEKQNHNTEKSQYLCGFQSFANAYRIYIIERRNGQYHLPADIDRLYMLRKKTQPEANNDKILISVKEACELPGLSEKTMRSLMNENCFMVRIGRRTLIDKKKFQKWIDRQS